ncbi:thiol:disulfide interchange protein DsbA/DsbL [Chitinibacter sp. S2-10]|uniref:thiol:disulfide interchange protein DsbA/DsbL n=1 Tax=Chitinibacter sp. S2-10 TaxID=3373597 RepID=UPI003977DC2D
MLQHWIKSLLISVSLLAAGTTYAITEGKDYKALAKPQPLAVAGKQEVIEFFWYGCPHCAAVEPSVEKWEAKLPASVNFRRVHVMWDGRSDMEGHAKIFLALEGMGLTKKHQIAVFNAIQKERIELRKEDVLFNWVKKQGIDLAKFKANYNGFSTKMQLNKLSEMTRTYAVDSVPMFIVNGKWVTSPSMAGGEGDEVTKVINELLAKPAAKKASK